MRGCSTPEATEQYIVSRIKQGVSSDELIRKTGKSLLGIEDICFKIVCMDFYELRLEGLLIDEAASLYRVNFQKLKDYVVGIAIERNNKDRSDTMHLSRLSIEKYLGIPHASFQRYCKRAASGNQLFLNRRRPWALTDIEMKAVALKLPHIASKDQITREDFTKVVHGVMNEACNRFSPPRGKQMLVYCFCLCI